jgi:hypothetical protein
MKCILLAKKLKLHHITSSLHRFIASSLYRFIASSLYRFIASSLYRFIASSLLVPSFACEFKREAVHVAGGMGHVAA